MRFPVGAEPFYTLMTLDESFHLQHIDADGKFPDYDLVSAANYGTSPLTCGPAPCSLLGALTRGRAKRLETALNQPDSEKIPGGARLCL